MTGLRRSPRLALLSAAVVAAAAFAPIAGAGAAGSATAAAAPGCATSSLSAALKIGSPGAGQRFATLILTNRSSRTCRTGGYVGLLLVARNGRALPTKTVRVSSPSPRTLTVRPGGKVSARLHWGAVAGTGDNQNGACQPTAKTLQITPPNQVRRLSIRWTQGPVCERGTFDVNALISR